MMKNKLAAIVFAVACVGTLNAQEMQPTMNQRETVANQTLRHRFFTFDGTSKGVLQYNGAGGVGAKYFGFNNFSADYLGFFTANTTRFFAEGVEQMRMDLAGVTIGTNPASTAIKLTINGAIDVKAGIAAQYQDVAEWVPAVGGPTPGTVVILDQNTNNTVAPSATPYDTRVAGVVSPQPGLILGIPGADKVMVATTGRVKVKVDASAAPIKIGDLLVTSDKAGVAMKSIPVDIAGIQMHRPGTVVGKALEPLASGTGEILVLLSLQ
jgi:hypothetical protein